ncbi:hypothetical protein RCH06_002866 [Polaromonas sp. CG_9.5]|uniref:hypothetical protein n=1 Tax=Polaromonas sp. CG_9.5 TaxID=3071705 RepID=UPI002E00FB04|nr:hypothetical protein [Polaromonas sp. CG_9.5]
MPVLSGTFRHSRILRVLELLAGLSMSGAAAATACDSPVLGALAGVERSQWEEFDAQGKSLVRERGTLVLAGLQVSGRCSDVDWSAQWTRSQGERAYDGMTTTQQPLQTNSQLRAQAITIAAWLPLGEGWAVGSQLDYRQLDRNIASTGSVLGYPERFDYLQAALGARYQTALAEGLRLTASGWLGGGPGGRVRVALPRADVVTLALGSSRLLALRLQLDGGESVRPGWSWQAGVAYRREQTSAGTPEALTRNGVTVGAAFQPRFVQRHLETTAVLAYRF